MDRDGGTALSGTPSLAGQVAVVTGAARGIGRALVQQFVLEGLRAVVAFDRDADALADFDDAARADTRVVTHAGDVRSPADLEALVRRVEDDFGRIDVFCSNAGVMTQGGVDSLESVWQTAWDVNVMAHVHAARLVLPGMLARGTGALVQVLSAAGFLSAPDSAPYTVTKHAAFGLAEVLAVTYGEHGITVCAVCPEAVDTQLLRDSLAQGGGTAQRVAGQVITAEAVAERTVRSLKAGDFLVTTHPHTERAAQKKWADIDKWVRAMGAVVNEGND